jgi:hypothetical protein
LELDERLGFGELIAQRLTDPWWGKNTQLPLPDLLRQSVYSRIAGYSDAPARKQTGFPLPGRAKVGRSRAAGVARDGKMRKTGPMGEVGCTINGGQEAKTEILDEIVHSLRSVRRPAAGNP